MKIPILRRLITKSPAKSAGTKDYTRRSARSVNENPIRIKRPKERIKSKKGYRKDLDTVVKSKMEANVFRYLKHIQDKHGSISLIEYEPEIFFFENNPFGIRAYIPDFKVTSRKGVKYIEVKGVMDQKAIEKKRLFEKYYPRLKLYFITPVEYSKIAQNYQKYIRNWE